MSKTNKSHATKNTISLNGVPKLTTYVNEYGSSSSNYTMSPWEKLAYEYAEKEFAQNLENINVFSEETLKSLSNQIDAYTKSGIKKIDEVYAPMIKSLQNDIASRFGNLDNSIFLDKLSSIEDKRANSVAALSEDIQAKESDLIGEELEKRYNYLSFLNNYQNQILQNALGNSTKSTSNALSGQSKNQSSYENLTEDLESVAKSVLAALGQL